MADKNIPESSEESKARHAPGPFYTKTFAGRTTVYERPYPIACFQPGETVGPAEMARYADLLNKGTHFDEILVALKMMKTAFEAPEGWGDGSEYITICEAIAKAEGTDD